jgi:hypothetical protein
MTTTYEVWDMETANQVGAFESEAEARKFLSEMLRANGADTVNSLSVAAVSHDESGVVDQTLVIDGPDFIAEQDSLGLARER